MKLKYIALLLVFAVIYVKAVAQGGKAKLSPFTRLYLADQQKSGNQLPKQYSYKKDASGNSYLAAMVKVNAGVNLETIHKLGAVVGTKAGKVWTVSIPVWQFPAFMQLPGIDYIQLDEPLSNNMDAARAVTRTDSVHNGNLPLPMSYTGKNVVVGIIDAGFDYNHPTLRDTLGSQWRIRQVWEQKSTGTAPSGFAFGNELTDSTPIKIKGTDMTGFSHGTHVAGIAGGSGFGSAANKQFRGIAFQSDLILVGITPDSNQWIETGMSDIIDGMSYIYRYASNAGKPAVANLSWGCTIGSHDGTSLFSEACDALTGKGKIFVCSGGNNGDNNIHLGKAFTATDTIVSTILTVPDPVRKTWLDVWGDTAKKFCINITLYDGTTAGNKTGFICLDNLVHHYELIGSDGDTCYIDLVTDEATFNDKPRMFLRVHQKSNNAILITVKATEGNINLWTGYVEKATGYYGSLIAGVIPGTTAGNTDMTTGDIADTKSAVAVASFASKVNFTNLSGSNISYTGYVGLGRRAPYSSKGPTVDGRVKPDIAGPGLMIGSGVSSFDAGYAPSGASYNHSVAQYTNPVDGKNYYYAMLTGTSMSSPVVAGIVALMLEVNPDLDPQKVIELLKETAIHDIYTGVATPTGNNNWGHGKVNAFAAVNKTLQRLGISSSAGIEAANCRIYPNPVSGILNIDFISARNESIVLEIYNMMGKCLLTQQWTVATGNNHQILNLSSFAQGLYFTRISSAAQGNITMKLLVK